MSVSAPINDPASLPASDSSRWPIRVRPGVVIVAVAAFITIVPGLIWPRTQLHFVSLFGGPAVGGLLVAAWWLFRSRARGWDRLLIPVLLFVPALALCMLIFRGASAMAVVIYFLPAVAALGVLWLAVTPALPRVSRRLGLVIVMLAGWATASLLRYDGTDGDLVPEFRWCWHPSPEERFQAERGALAGPAAVKAELYLEPSDWPGFRGPNRDSAVYGLKIETDWAKDPPKEIWKHRVGPGWGSCAVVGDRLFTQEQIGDDEAVVCYATATGARVWEHLEPGRFFEPMSGTGPRATPTFHDGKIFAQGPRGRLVCLDAASGKKVWDVDVKDGTEGKMPQWGYSASPLVIQGLVIAYAGGPEGKGIAAYKETTGELAWSAGKATHCYTSAQRTTLGGVEQVLMVSDYGLQSFRPTDGRQLWENAWPLGKGLNRVTQPAVLGDTDLVFTTGVGGDQGIRRLRVTKAGDGWDVKMLWTSKAVKPYYNDGVVYQGHFYGFDGERLCCVNLEDGKLKWDDGLYGHGQVLLLADQGLLLVQAVNGSVVLLEANSNELSELGRFPAIATKTWNHPVLVRGKLFVRNAQEAACYELKQK